MRTKIHNWCLIIISFIYTQILILIGDLLTLAFPAAEDSEQWKIWRQTGEIRYGMSIIDKHDLKK